MKHAFEPVEQELQGASILMTKQTWDIGRSTFFQRKILLCTHYYACVIHLLEVCKYNFTEAGIAAFQNMYIGCGWRRGSHFLISTSK